MEQSEVTIIDRIRRDFPAMPPAPPLRLLADQVLIEPLRKFERFEEKSASGLLYLPSNPERDKSVEFLWWGRVVLVGPGDKYRYPRQFKTTEERERRCYARKDGGRFPMELQPGDVVLFERRPWGNWAYEGREFTIVHEEQHVSGYWREESTDEDLLAAYARSAAETIGRQIQADVDAYLRLTERKISVSSVRGR